MTSKTEKSVNDKTSTPASPSPSFDKPIITTTNSTSHTRASLELIPDMSLYATNNDDTSSSSSEKPKDSRLKVVADDPSLAPFQNVLKMRHEKYLAKKKELVDKEGSLLQFSKGYEKFGILKVKGGIQYNEWAPGAQEIFLVGDFNKWNKTSHPLKKQDYGVWSIFLPDQNDGTPAISHGSKIKIYMRLANGEWDYRIPPWLHRVVQEKGNPIFDGVFWNPSPYQWKNKAPSKPKDIRIYECHVGMSAIEPKINSYTDFANDIIPMVKKLGYNTIQLMAVMEHAYYASFGYQITSFFAVSSRCGTPEELMYLIDTAHGHGITVLLDVVHSHASKNVSDGLNMFDGTQHCYFHEGTRGTHPVWDSRLFNYSHWEVLRFLMSNLRWYAEHYRFDGFRFDGVQSMLYFHRGSSPANSYEHYFGPEVDEDAITYLLLANDMLHELNPNVITIAEEVTGMPTLCRPIVDGGFGFDYRLGMGIPDKWIDLLKKHKDEEWDMGNITYTLTNRRFNEATIAYVESHDQALVGDKTTAFWLMDKEMYTHMSVLQEPTPVIARGIALHKMIRLITFSLGGEGYLTFMGNDFGHPEWIDFPREGNDYSYHHCRRRWDLAEDKLLRYQHLRAFDVAMNSLEDSSKWLLEREYIQCKNEADKVIAYERGGLLFILNFHPTASHANYKIGVTKPGKYNVVLNSDEVAYGGFARIDTKEACFSVPEKWHDLDNHIQVYLPSRVCLVLKCVD
eukprot:TRINITY_DN1762_c0_g1_i1.p1 TRINITY_DN1762_c0_g1~~TRINITY_DN1762_c0_g1_i1.p1  ORF type:complete len:773 (+),score=216.46 TRINITY_DN1762_c0_g1_i1:112-2319(+)